MKYYGIKKRKTEGYSVEICGNRRSILFSYGQVEFERTYYKKLQADMNILRTLPLIHYWHSQKIFPTKT